jgi:Oxygenase domain of the 2OGFeDO superfamily
LKRVQLFKKLSDLESEAFKGQMMSEVYYDELLSPDDEGLEVLKPDGSLLLKIQRKAVPARVANAAIPFMRKAKEPITNRGTAAGIQGGDFSYASKTAGGYKTNTTRLPDAVARGLGSSSTVGYYDRYPRTPFCRVCRHTEQNPVLWQKFVPLVGVADEVFKHGNPARYAVQKALSAQTEQTWMIGHSVFTTVTINKNFRTAAHKDAGDFSAGFGVMACIVTGRVKGGYLVFPQYRIAVEIQNLDIVLFDVHEWHGNTDLGLIGESERFTCVFYYREMMCRCGTPEEELRRSKKCRELKTLYCQEEIDKGDRRIQLATQATK